MVIRLEGIDLAYGEKSILQNINLSVQQREIMVVMGPSGSGKSTLLRLMIGLMKPTAGKVWVNEEEISGMREEELNKIRRGMGMVFQYSALFDSMTVGENVAFGLRQHSNLTEEEIGKIVRRKLKMVGLSGRENWMPNQMSGGMKKRVSLARAIAVNPAIVLYDEPTAGLDPIMAGIIDRLIVGTKRVLGVTSVVVTHDMISAFRIADRIAMIQDGEILEIGTPEEIKNSNHPKVQRFISGHSAPGGKGRRKGL